MMAEMPKSISVAVERAAHDALKAMANNLWQQHRIALLDVRISWMDIKAVGQPAERHISGIEISTRTEGEG